MKILQTICSMHPSNGGPIEVIKQFEAVLREHGCTTEIASLDSPEEPFLRGLGVPVHPLGSAGGKYGYSKRWVPWLRENASNYDVVIVNGLWTYNSFGTWRALRGGHTPYMVFTHGMLDPWFKRQYPLKHLKKWLYWPWAEYRVLRDASVVLFTCEEERRLARESFCLYRCNEAIAGLGIASPEGDASDQQREFLDHFPHLRGKRLALFLSRIHPKKGCDLLLQAFADRFAEDLAWHLVMAGPDQVGWKAELHRHAVRLGIADQITWTGMLSGAVKWGAYRAAEVFVLPSHSENFGIVVAEALACGLPVLISDKVNIWREIAASEAGIVASDTLDGTKNLFTGWLGMSTEQQKHMRRQAKACFEVCFEVNRTASGFADILGRIAASRGRLRDELSPAFAPIANDGVRGARRSPRNY
ncbi:MAG TPA: glycosyltransferase [Terriglobales bacterium]|nr:glycosyltransferase [Terriglobales bacterium]